MIMIINRNVNQLLPILFLARGEKSVTSAIFCLLPYKYKLILLDNQRQSALTFCSQAKVKWVLDLIMDFRCL